jgi:predicted GTPase
MTNETKYSAMEISGVGKIMLVDTVGVDVEKSTAEKSAESIEVALILISNDSFELELAWISKLKKLGASVITVISQCDKFSDGGKSLSAAVDEVSGLKSICTSAETGAGIEELHTEIINRLKG